MKCRDFHKMIHRFLDGESGEEEKRKLEEHLESCKACARFLEDHRLLKSLFRPETVAPPETLRPRILAALEAAGRDEEAGRREGVSLIRDEVRVIRLFRRAALAALLFLAVSAALFFGGPAPLIAENRDSEIHYEDLFSIAPPGALLDVLVRTRSPSEAMRLAAGDLSPAPSEAARERSRSRNDHH